jgi:hypothetical protein
MGRGLARLKRALGTPSHHGTRVQKWDLGDSLEFSDNMHDLVPWELGPGVSAQTNWHPSLKKGLST